MYFMNDTVNHSWLGKYISPDLRCVQSLSKYLFSGTLSFAHSVQHQLARLDKARSHVYATRHVSTLCNGCSTEHQRCMLSCFRFKKMTVATPFSVLTFVVGGLSVLWQWVPSSSESEPTCAESILRLSNSIVSAHSFNPSPCQPVTVSAGPFWSDSSPFCRPPPHLLLSPEVALVAWTLAGVGWFLVILCLILSRRKSPITVHSSAHMVHHQQTVNGPTTPGSVRARALTGPRSPSSALDPALR